MSEWKALQSLAEQGLVLGNHALDAGLGLRDGVVRDPEDGGDVIGVRFEGEPK